MPSKSGTILIVDDDPMNRTLLATSLKDQGYRVEMAEDGLQALERLRAQSFDAVLLDLLMPGMDGFEVLTWIRSNERFHHLPVIIISVVEEIESVIRCIEMGATDYLLKPFDPLLLQSRLNASLAAKRLHDREHEYLRNVSLLTDAAAAVEAETFDPDSLAEVAARSDALGHLARVFQNMASQVYARQQSLQHQIQAASRDRYKFGEILGKSPVMQKVYERIAQASASNAGVLIWGESGAGKELIARTIHQMSDRKEQAFVAVNCGAVPETLFEREFFGHRKGAFTGATMDKGGYFDRAHKGTLFLDEVGELTPAMQVKLLRVLQDGEYIPLGDSHARQADVRIIAATNKDLKELLQKGAIRDDFFYRIRVIVIEVPPLRERKEDIPLLIDHFLERYAGGKERPMLPGTTIKKLCAYHWPGNIRELQNELQRYLAQQTLEFDDTFNLQRRIGDDMMNTAFDQKKALLQNAMEEFEKRFIAEVFERSHGNRTDAAEILGIDRKTLYRKLKKYGAI